MSGLPTDESMRMSIPESDIIKLFRNCFLLEYMIKSTKIDKNISLSHSLVYRNTDELLNKKGELKLIRIADAIRGITLQCDVEHDIDSIILYLEIKLPKCSKLLEKSIDYLKSVNYDLKKFMMSNIMTKIRHTNMIQSYYIPIKKFTDIKTNYLELFDEYNPLIYEDYVEFLLKVNYSHEISISPIIIHNIYFDDNLRNLDKNKLIFGNLDDIY